MKRALVTGITGQDGSFLAEFLLAKGYEVHGIIRRASSFNTGRIDHIFRDPHEATALYLHYGDLTDSSSLLRILALARPDELYNLAAQSHVMVSFHQPVYTADTIGLGTLRLLEAVREYQERTGKQVRFYQAGSSEMFGSSPPPQSETTAFHPRNPYGVSKVAAHWFAINFREAYGLFVCNGILFNHESERRGETFVSRKITRAVGRIKCKLQSRLYLGKLEVKRDWGFAGDYVEAMWLMLQREAPDDFVIATGTSHSVREFLELAFGLEDLRWPDYVEFDPRYVRPSDVDHLSGDATKARNVLRWQAKMSFEELVRRMVRHDVDLARREALLQNWSPAEGPQARAAVVPNR